MKSRHIRGLQFVTVQREGGWGQICYLKSMNTQMTFSQSAPELDISLHLGANCRQPYVNCSRYFRQFVPSHPSLNSYLSLFVLQQL